MDNYIIKIPKNDRTEHIINFIKNGIIEFDSSKLNFPRGMKSQSERAIWLFEKAFSEIEQAESHMLIATSKFSKPQEPLVTSNNKINLIDMLK